MKEHIMTTPERVLMRRRLQKNDDQARSAEAARPRKQEDPWIIHFIAKLSDFIRKIGLRPEQY
jgi:hypothetical protein